MTEAGKGEESRGKVGLGKGTWSISLAPSQHSFCKISYHQIATTSSFTEEICTTFISEDSLLFLLCSGLTLKGSPSQLPSAVSKEACAPESYLVSWLEAVWSQADRGWGIFSSALGLKVSFVETEDREGGRGPDHLVKIPGIKEQSLPKF